ncbi:unnamed protein product, partial [Ectocarpus sp. 4 AP-2014]
MSHESRARIISNTRGAHGLRSRHAHKKKNDLLEDEFWPIFHQRDGIDVHAHQQLHSLGEAVPMPQLYPPAGGTKKAQQIKPPPTPPFPLSVCHRGWVFVAWQRRCKTSRPPRC